MRLVEVTLPEPRLPLLDEPAKVGDQGACPVCGRAMTRMAASRMPCHARCLFDEQAPAVLKIVGADAHVRLAELGARYGVTRQLMARLLGYGGQ